MLKKLLLVAIGLCLIGCAPSLYVTEKVLAPDGTEFYSVITKTNGHPAETSTETYRITKSGQKGKQVASHATGAKGAAVSLGEAALVGPASALSLGLPAALLRPDETNVQQTGGGATAMGGAANATGGSATANATADAQSSATANAAAAAVQSQTQTLNNTVTNTVTNQNRNNGNGWKNGWVPPGQAKK